MITDKANTLFFERENAHNGTEPYVFIGIVTGHAAHVLKAHVYDQFMNAILENESIFEIYFPKRIDIWELCSYYIPIELL